ncbi:MAG: ChaN family lipoprotein [Turicibacter sp.]
MEVILNYLNENYMSPTQYIQEKLKKHDVILLGESHAVQDTLNTVIEMIPALYESGCFNIGMEFGCYEDQESLDALVTSSIYDEEKARDIMFNYNVKWPYQEYLDIYKAAWTFNQTLSKMQRPFRILNLSYRYDWSNFNGIRTPESAKKVFYKGNIESYRYQVIKNEILEKNEKILVLTGTCHAYTNYKVFEYSSNDDDFVRFQGNFLGNRLYNTYGNRIFSVLMHQYFINKDTLAINVTPGNGKIEEIMKQLNQRPCGFDLYNSPVGELSDNSYFSIGYTNFQLKDYFDGYLFIKPLSETIGCTVDYDFLKGRSFLEVQENYPDSDWAPIPKTEDEYWKVVESFASPNI